MINDRIGLNERLGEKKFVDPYLAQKQVFDNLEEIELI